MQLTGRFFFKQKMFPKNQSNKIEVKTCIFKILFQNYGKFKILKNHNMKTFFINRNADGRGDRSSRR